MGDESLLVRSGEASIASHRSREVGVRDIGAARAETRLSLAHACRVRRRYRRDMARRVPAEVLVVDQHATPASAGAVPSGLPSQYLVGLPYTATSALTATPLGPLQVPSRARYAPPRHQHLPAMRKEPASALRTRHALAQGRPITSRRPLSRAWHTSAYATAALADAVRCPATRSTCRGSHMRRLCSVCRKRTSIMPSARMQLHADAVACAILCHSRPDAPH